MLKLKVSSCKFFIHSPKLNLFLWWRGVPLLAFVTIREVRHLHTSAKPYSVHVPCCSQQRLLLGVQVLPKLASCPLTRGASP